MFVKDKEEMLRYEAAERFRLDYNSAIKGATEEGIEKGKAEGFKLGEAKGIKIGEEIGEKNNAKRIAAKMLQLGEPIAKIKMLTDLSESEIIDLKD